MDEKEKSIRNKEPMFWVAAEEETIGALQDFQDVFKKLGYEYYVYLMKQGRKRKQVELVAVCACLKKDLPEILIEETEKGALVSTERIELSELMGFEFEKTN
jgi:hypothetical protein